jgi:hypothetical protein
VRGGGTKTKREGRERDREGKRKRGGTTKREREERKKKKRSKRNTLSPLTSISFSLKKLSGFLFSTMRPTGCSGNRSSGQIFVTSSGSKSKLSSAAGSIVWIKSCHSG